MSNSRSDDYSPLIKLIILIILSTLALFVFQFLALLVVLPLSGMDLMTFADQMANPIGNPEMKSLLLIVQFAAALGAFIIAPWFFIYRFENRSLRHYFYAENIVNTALGLTIFVTLAFMVVNGIFIEWNMNLEFPGAFQDWAAEKEEVLKVLTEYLTSFDSFGYFIGAFLVIAVMPAIGEEFLFRGLIQQYLTKIFGNAHVAIWAAALFFSAFHMQFFGFVPRLLLGAFFGYLFYFSGNLWYAVLAHFVNNGFTLMMLYVYQQGMIDYNIENSESVPLETASVFLIIGVGLFYLFVRQFQFKEKVE